METVTAGKEKPVAFGGRRMTRFDLPPVRTVIRSRQLSPQSPSQESSLIPVLQVPQSPNLTPFPSVPHSLSPNWLHFLSVHHPTRHFRVLNCALQPSP